MHHAYVVRSTVGGLVLRSFGWQSKKRSVHLSKTIQRVDISGFLVNPLLPPAHVDFPNIACPNRFCRRFLKKGSLPQWTAGSRRLCRRLTPSRRTRRVQRSWPHLPMAVSWRREEPTGLCACGWCTRIRWADNYERRRYSCVVSFSNRSRFRVAGCWRCDTCSSGIQRGVS